MYDFNFYIFVFSTKNGFRKTLFWPLTFFFHKMRFRGHRGWSYKFQTSWFNCYSWLNWSINLNKVIFFHCSKASQIGLLTFSKNVKGFSNWKKGKEKFNGHEKSECHKEVLLKLANVNNEPIHHQLISAKAIAENKESHDMLDKPSQHYAFLQWEVLQLEGMVVIPLISFHF